MVPLSFAAATVVFLALAPFVGLAWPWLTLAAASALQLALYLHASLRGKFRIWERLLDDADLTGDERVLDLGCGRGAVTVAAARRVPRGAVDGVDLWRSVDQSGNDEEAARANAVAVGVSDRVQLHTGDVGDLSFADNTFDVVVSSLVIHNIHDQAHRASVISEGLRVLKPGGRFVIADIDHAREYAAALRSGGATEVQVTRLGLRGWFGNPWFRMTSVRARSATS
ncbi:MAG: SAM-dependent methyltransferase [Aeromicrobium sp.]|nr:SAM-dependent methyltransferase [Aeromicrobium sp.]